MSGLPERLRVANRSQPTTEFRRAGSTGDDRTSDDTEEENRPGAQSTLDFEPAPHPRLGLQG
jgi:hypothetical protein